MRYGRGRDVSKRASARTFADAPRGSGKSCRSKVSTNLLSFSRAIRWYLQIEFLTHRAALERAADPKSRPIYSVFHGLSAGIFRLNFSSLDHEKISRTSCK